MKKNILIIGNGVAGVTAARFIRKLGDHRITIVSDETDHFYARTALMYIYMGHMRYRDTKPYEDWFWTKNRIDLVRGRVVEVDTAAHQIILGSDDRIPYDELLIAAGSTPVRLGRPGEDLPGVQSLYGMPDLELMERQTKEVRRAVVVGGGLIGVEVAEMLRSRHIPVTFLVRERSYMDHVLPAEESRLVNGEIRDHGVDLRLETEVASLEPGTSGRLAAVVTTNGEVIECDFAALTVGVGPNVGFLDGSNIETDRGILVNGFFETSAPDVYAAGDCVQFRNPSVAHRPIEQLWYTARRHGETVGRTIAGYRTAYDKGVFFNSAKFFALEYQTYGDVPPHLTPDQDSVHWQDPARKRLVRIHFERSTGRVLGFNVFGTRFRQTVCEHWIEEGRSVDYVLAHLREANFDPEFEPGLQRQVVTAYEPAR